MSVLTVFCYVMIVVVALLLIALIMIQPSKSGGMGAAFGGIGESVFGGKAGSHLTKTTVVLTAVFFVIALALAALIGHGNASTVNSKFQEALATEQKAEAPAAAPEAAAGKSVDTAKKGAGK